MLIDLDRAVTMVRPRYLHGGMKHRTRTIFSASAHNTSNLHLHRMHLYKGSFCQQLNMPRSRVVIVYVSTAYRSTGHLSGPAMQELVCQRDWHVLDCGCVYTRSSISGTDLLYTWSASGDQALTYLVYMLFLKKRACIGTKAPL